MLQEYKPLEITEQCVLRTKTALTQNITKQKERIINKDSEALLLYKLSHSHADRSGTEKHIPNIHCLLYRNPLKWNSKCAASFHCCFDRMQLSQHIKAKVCDVKQSRKLNKYSTAP